MIASPATPSYAETRVWGFELEEPARTRAQPTLSETCIEGYPPAYDEVVVGCSPVPRGGVTIATPHGPTGGRGSAPAILGNIREAGGTLDISRGQVSAQDLAALTRATGNEFAIFRNRDTGQLFVRELGPSMGQVPKNSRLVIHSQPGDGPLSVQPSGHDRQALEALGQRSSVIINEEGTFSIRFGVDNAKDGAIRPID